MKIGDKVSALDDAIDAVIIGVDGEMITVVTDDGFEMHYAKNELVVIGDITLEKEINSEDISKAMSQKVEQKPKKTPKVRPKERNLPPMEVDLHIQQLTNQFKRLSNYDMLSLQIDTAKRQLEFAIQKRIPKVVFIHGVGEGVLRAELEYLFNRYDGLKYYDADFQKYGKGAMEVYIFQNKKD